MIYPLPAVMVSCGSTPEEYNILTISWTGTICTDPAMCYISVRPGRHSYEIIKRNGAFVINLTTKKLAFATDWCGVKSGKNFNKFAEMGLTPVKSHHMFISEVVAVQADDMYYDKESGLFKLNEANPISYSHGKYYETGSFIGKFGFSVEKKKKPRK